MYVFLKCCLYCISVWYNIFFLYVQVYVIIIKFIKIKKKKRKKALQILRADKPFQKKHLAIFICSGRQVIHQKLLIWLNYLSAGGPKKIRYKCINGALPLKLSINAHGIVAVNIRKLWNPAELLYVHKKQLGISSHLKLNSYLETPKTTHTERKSMLSPSELNELKELWTWTPLFTIWIKENTLRMSLASCRQALNLWGCGMQKE